MPETPQIVNAPVDSGPNKIRRYLSPKEAAEYLGVGYSTLSIARMNRTGPAYGQWMRKIFYDMHELDRWMAAQTVVTTPVPEKRRIGRPRKERQ